MKKKATRVLHVFEVLLIFVAILLFILSQQKTLKYVTDELKQRYNIEYKEITGNLLTSIHIKDISYKDRVLAKDAKVGFNLLKLLLLKLDISSVNFSQVDVNHLKYFLSTLPKSSSKTTTKHKSKLPISVAVHDVSLDILPYKKDSLEIKKLKIGLKEFELSDSIVVNNLKVDMKSNYFNLAYNGSYRDKKLFIKNFSLTSLDTKKVLLLKDIIKSDSQSDDTLIKAVEIQRADISTLPFKAGHYKLKSLDISIDKLSSNDMKLFFAKDVKIDADTNIWKLSLKGDINSSVFNSKVKVELDDKYMKKFVPNLNFKSLNPVDVKLKIDKKRLIGDIKAHSNKLFVGLFEDMDIKVKELKTHAEFDFKKLSLFFNTKAKLSSKYSDEFLLDGNFTYDKNHFINYYGVVDFKDFKNLDKRVTKLLSKSRLNFKGDVKGIEAKLNSDYLEANYLSKDGFLKPKVVLTSKDISLKEFDANLTKDIKANFTVESNLNYKDIKSSTLNYQINSDVLNIDGEYLLDKNSLNFVTTLPKNSILKSNTLKLEKLFPITSTLKIEKELLTLNSKSDELDIKANYFTASKEYNITANGFDTKADITSNSNSINYIIDTNSLKTLLSGIDSFYKLPKLKIDGGVKVEGSYKDGKFNFDIDSSWFLDEYAQYKYLFMEKTTAKCSLDSKGLEISQFNSSVFALDRYRKLFLSKKSTISFLDAKSKLELYLNNGIMIKGDVGEKTNINISAYNYYIDEPEANLYINTNISYHDSPTYSSLKGRVDLLKGVIKYKPKTSREISDSDIVFVNKKRKKRVDSGLDSLNIKISTKKPIYYKETKNSIKLTSDLTILKKKNKELQALGTVTVLDGLYFSEGKRFELGRGKILFSGDLLNPYLELKAYYKKDPYNITIMIGGKLEAPVLNFSSTPYLTQNDILSILLFNTKASSLTNSDSNSNPALSLFGSSFAKGILDTIGVKLDRVELTSTKEGSIGFEVEKRVSKRTTIIYQNDIVQTIKVRYQNTQNIETDLTFSPNSSSIDIIYKNEK